MKTEHCEGTAILVGIPSETTLNLDDAPGHKVALTLYEYRLTSTCPDYDGGIQVSRGYRDHMGESGTNTGYYTLLMKNGEKAFGKWNSESKTKIKKDGSWEMTFTVQISQSHHRIPICWVDHPIFLSCPGHCSDLH